MIFIHSTSVECFVAFIVADVDDGDDDDGDEDSGVNILECFGTSFKVVSVQF